MKQYDAFPEVSNIMNRKIKIIPNNNCTTGVLLKAIQDEQYERDMAKIKAKAARMKEIEDRLSGSLENKKFEQYLQ